MPTLDQGAPAQAIASAKGPYGDGPASPEDRSRLRFWTTGEADPQLPARILALLTVRGELPLQFGFSCCGPDDRIELQFELRADAVMYPEQLLDRLLRVPTVRDASLKIVRPEP